MIKVMTFGIFDLFHVGHLNLLEQAKTLGEYLIVGVGSDESVKKEIKKKNKTIISEEDRVRIVSSLKVVDKAYVYDTYEDINRMIEDEIPDVICRGDDWEDFPGKEVAEMIGIPIVYIPYTSGVSSTLIRERIKNGGN